MSQDVFQMCMDQVFERSPRIFSVHIDVCEYGNNEKEYDQNLHSHLVEAWYSLEQYIGLKEDKLSSTTVDFIRSEGNLETKRLYWFRKPKMC